jgi:hypothetical protein
MFCFFKNFVNLWHKLLRHELSNTNCIIHIKNKVFEVINIKTFEYAYNIWRLDDTPLVGINGYNIYWNGSCKLYDESSQIFTMASLDFTIVHKYVADVFLK